MSSVRCLRFTRRWIRTLSPLLAVASVAHAVTTGPIEPTHRAYPPSCLSAPLTDVPSGPTYSATTQLAAVDRTTGEGSGFETVGFTAWRVACEGGRSALLLRIARAAAADPAKSVRLPFEYGMGARQAGRIGIVRLAQEPNARTSNLQPGALIDSAITLVVENLPQESDFPQVLVPAGLPAGVRSGPFDLDQPLDLVLPNANAEINPPPPAVVLSVPAYDKTAYANATLPMPITGYNAGNYFDPAHAGEGMIVEAGDVAGPAVAQNRYVSLAWFTYGANGKPFWLFGVTSFAPGARTVNVPLAYFDGGGFAGAFGASATPSAWGSVTVSFPDCASLRFTYASRAGLSPPVPSGSGERTWVRLTRANGLACD
jgi:hypothetical protein